MTTLNQVLKAMYRNYAVVFPPVDARKLAEANKFLEKKMGFPLPYDYHEFLSATDGLVWNGLQIAPLSDRYNDSQTFRYKGVMQLNLRPQNEFMKSFIWIGSYLEELIVYRPGEMCYQIIDRYTYETIYSFKSILDVLTFYAKALLEK